MGKTAQKKLDSGSVDQSPKPAESSDTKNSEEKKAPIRLLLEFDDKHDPAVMDLVEAITARSRPDDDVVYEEAHRRGRIPKAKAPRPCAVWNARTTRIKNKTLLRDEADSVSDIS